MKKSRRNFVVITLLILGSAMALLAFSAASSSALAEATIQIDGRPVQFQLRQYDRGVRACVNFDPDWIHFRQSVGKRLHGATEATVRAARFTYDRQRQQAKFVFDGGAVLFERRGVGRWSIQPVVFELPG